MYLDGFSESAIEILTLFLHLQLISYEVFEIYYILQISDNFRIREIKIEHPNFLKKQTKTTP